jgi:hypothetical protein
MAVMFAAADMLNVGATITLRAVRNPKLSNANSGEWGLRREQRA